VGNSLERVSAIMAQQFGTPDPQVTRSRLEGGVLGLMRKGLVPLPGVLDFLGLVHGHPPLGVPAIVREPSWASR
jgi:hypothetical protein